MDQTHLGYTTWRDPPHNSLNGVPLKTIDVPVAGTLGVSVEGSAHAWPGDTEPARLPTFDAVTRVRHWVEVFNRGQGPIAFHAEAAMKQGASREQVLETMGMAVYMGAGPSVMYAAQALEAFDQFNAKRALAEARGAAQAA